MKGVLFISGTRRIMRHVPCFCPTNQPQQKVLYGHKVFLRKHILLLSFTFLHLLHSSAAFFRVCANKLSNAMILRPCSLYRRCNQDTMRPRVRIHSALLCCARSRALQRTAPAHSGLFDLPPDGGDGFLGSAMEPYWTIGVRAQRKKPRSHSAGGVLVRLPSA